MQGINCANFAANAESCFNRFDGYNSNTEEGSRFVNFVSRGAELENIRVKSTSGILAALKTVEKFGQVLEQYRQGSAAVDIHLKVNPAHCIEFQLIVVYIPGGDNASEDLFAFANSSPKLAALVELDFS